MLPSSITAIILAAVLFVGFFIPSSLATAQLQQQQTTTTTTMPTTPPPSLSITTTPPLTPEEQEQQNRLQNVIAATTANLNETEKEVSGVVFTPRWSEPLWVNANSIAVIVAYCLPGEFAESGQEILGGFELEVLVSYAIDLPQGFMAWMAVVGNEDGNVRLPAAVGVICASDLNEAQARVLSPEEQQQINNVISQFTTQITNIDQVINIINNVTTNETSTEPVTPPPPIEDTAPPVFIDPKPEDVTINPEFPTDPNAGSTYYFSIQVKDNVDGKAWYEGDDTIQQDDVGGDISIECNPGTAPPPKTPLIPLGSTTFECTAVDEAGNVGTYSWTVTVALPPEEGEVLPPPETGEEGQPPGGGLLPGIAPGEEEQQEQPQAPPPTVPEEGEPTTGSGEEEEDTGGAPPPDETPPPTTEEEPTTPPEGGE